MTPTQQKHADQIRALEALAEQDAELRRIEAQIAEGETQLQTLTGELSSLDARLASETSSLAEMHKSMGDLNLEARQMSAQIDRSREKLARARNERENVAVEREIEELRKLVRDREDELKKLAPLSDAAKKSLGDLEVRRAKVAGELESSESGTLASIRDAKAEAERARASRDELAKKIPPALLKRYQQVLGRKGSGLAKVGIAQLEKGRCLSCHISLQPQLYQRIVYYEVVEQCPNCYRVLAPPPLVEGPESEAT